MNVQRNFSYAYRPQLIRVIRETWRKRMSTQRKTFIFNVDDQKVGVNNVKWKAKLLNVHPMAAVAAQLKLLSERVIKHSSNFVPHFGCCFFKLKFINIHVETSLA